MNTSEIVFWNVDTQKDFVSPKGKLYVKGAELLKPVWNELTQLAEKYSIRVINTADYHFNNSAELDITSPDFVNTFPPHCMANTKGADFVKETRPAEPEIFDWNKDYLITPEVLDPQKNRNIIIRKDAFDAFAGNRWTSKIVELIAPKMVFVYGVTTNVCVDAAVVGLVSRVKNVYVVTDAIKELPNIGLPFQKWKKLRVKSITSEALKALLEKK